MEEKKKVVVGVGAIVISKDEPGKLLIVEEAASNDDLGKKVGMLAIPTGHLEPGEDPEQRVLIELLEETGYTGVVRGLFGIYHINKAIGFVYLVDITGKQTEVLDPDIKSISWLTPKEILDKRDNLRPAVFEVVSDYLEGKSTETVQIRRCF